MRLTPWFSVNEKPARVGTYQTALEDRRGWSYWNGKYWGNQYQQKERPGPKNAAGDQDKKWRGLAHGRDSL